MEYHHALKSNNFDLLWRTFKQLMFVMYYLGSHYYVKNMLLQIIHINYLKSVNHPVYLSMKKNISSFIEEDGEISLSYLAKWTSKSNIRSNREGTESKYLSIYNFIQTFHQLKYDLSISSSSTQTSSQSSSRYTIHKSSNDVIQVIDYFKNIIEQIRKMEILSKINNRI